MQSYTRHKNDRCELLLACRVGASFQTGDRLDICLQDILQNAVNSLEFHQAGLVLLPQGKNPVCWHAGRDEEAETGTEQRLSLNKFLTLVNKKSKKGRKMLEPLQPVIATTLPVVLKSGDPVSILEIGIFGTDRSNAQYMLVKAVSVARHIADTLQESFFQRQKDPHLRKLAVWLEMINTISSTLDIREVLHVVCQLTADFFSAKSCIYLLDEEGQTIVPVVGVGSYDPNLKRKLKALRGTRPFPAIKRVIETQQPVIVTPANRKRLLTPEIIKDFAYSWMVLAPILSKDKTIGVMQVDRPLETAGFNQEETEIIFAIARATAIALENAQLIEMLGQKEHLLHQLVNKLITAQEDERKRLAADLHDGIIQSLIAIWYRLQRITPPADVQDEEWQTEISDLTRLLNEQILDIRRILYDLRPLILDNYGLFPAVESYVQNLQGKNNISVELTIHGNNKSLTSRIEITLFRILQEALTNVLKHANASSARVELITEANMVSLTVEDNGSGLDTSLLSTANYQDRLGLAGIQERALLLNGTCNIVSHPGKGTCISVAIPIPENVDE
ncbi:MAG: GAF domain-containing sensor histidine kinase [Bacillota bacterium]